MDNDVEIPPVDPAGESHRSLFERGQWWVARAVAWSATSNWRMTAEWRALRPALMRYTGHAAIFALALIALFAASVQFPQAIAAIRPTAPAAQNEASARFFSPRPAQIAPATPTTVRIFTLPDNGTIVRQALPQTTIPDRLRAQVMTYTVQSGDTVFGIAEKFGLTPYTIYWANTETLEDNPHRLSLGMVLNILPVDGVYHTVSAGETIEGVARQYGVEPEALFNEWNHLEQGQPLQPGMQLTIPGGAREFIAWQLPKTVTSNGGSAVNQGRQGVCVGSYSGLPGRGWFDWPTSGRRISGWTFRDARNPAHSGLDIGLRTGDAVFAADGGVVIFAGWWGSSGYGNLVVIDHLNGWQTWYAHLSQVNVVCGQQVFAGDIIGLGGSTGWSSGPHLHLEIRLEGAPYDPLAYLP